MAQVGGGGGGKSLKSLTTRKTSKELARRAQARKKAAAASKAAKKKAAAQQAARKKNTAARKRAQQVAASKERARRARARRKAASARGARERAAMVSPQAAQQAFAARRAATTPVVTPATAPAATGAGAPVIAPQGYGAGGVGAGAGGGGTSQAISDALAGNVTAAVQQAAAAAGMSVAEYMAWAKRFYAPVRAQLEAQWRARLAQQGILSSTAAAGQFTQNELEMGAKEAQFAEEARRWDIARQDTQAQNAFENAAKAYELQQAGAIGQAPYVTKVNWPNTPKMFSGVYGQMWQAPAASQPGKNVTEYQYGDAPERGQRNPFGLTFVPPQWGPNGPIGDANWPTYPVDVSTRMKAQQSFEAGEAAKDRALQERQLQMQAAAAGLKWVPGQGWVKDEGAEAAAKSDQMWAAIGQMVAGNLTAGKETPGQNLAPSQLSRIIQSSFGLDIASEVRKGNQQAVNLILSMWPKTGGKIVAAIQANPQADINSALQFVQRTTGGEEGVGEGGLNIGVAGAQPGEQGLQWGGGRSTFAQAAELPWGELKGSELIPKLYKTLNYPFGMKTPWSENQ